MVAGIEYAMDLEPTIKDTMSYRMVMSFFWIEWIQFDYFKHSFDCIIFIITMLGMQLVTMELSSTI
jgi:hypothetical protein